MSPRSKRLASSYYISVETLADVLDIVVVPPSPELPVDAYELRLCCEIIAFGLTSLFQVRVARFYSISYLGGIAYFDSSSLSDDVDDDS